MMCNFIFIFLLMCTKKNRNNYLYINQKGKKRIKISRHFTQRRLKTYYFIDALILLIMISTSCLKISYLKMSTIISRIRYFQQQKICHNNSGINTLFLINSVQSVINNSLYNSGSHFKL